MSSYAQVHGLSVVSGLVNKVCLICCTLKAMLYILIRESCNMASNKKIISDNCYYWTRLSKILGFVSDEQG